jgi:hypothetical protein
MLTISRLVIFFFAFLLSLINSGLISTNVLQNTLTEPEESYPTSHRISIQSIFVWTGSDHRLKDDLVPGNPLKIFQKSKLDWRLKPLVPSQSDIHYNLLSDNKDPELLTDIFGPADISFPFNYFW